MRFRLSLIVLLYGLFVGRACASDTLFQASTIDALMRGIYDGTMTVGELRKHGDFGLGTVNSLDGELIALNGHFYQGLSDGRVLPVKAGMKTPFATVTFFQAERRWKVGEIKSFADLQRIIDQELPSKNLFYAVRITGDFSLIKLRSVPRQRTPYRPLVEVVKSQSEFVLRETRGTLVGFRCPPYVGGVNVPGYHFHFLTDDATRGGHVLDCVIRQGKVEVDILPAFSMLLPQNKTFLQADLSRHEAEALRTVEQGGKRSN